MSNKITTPSYFIKRLRDSGYEVWKIYDRYGDSDPRSWTVVIDPGVASLFCTCFINAAEWDDNYFELWDGNNYVPNKFKIKTDSIEVFISYLVRYGINNKTNSKYYQTTDGKDSQNAEEK